MVVYDLENEDTAEQGCYIDQIFEKRFFYLGVKLRIDEKFAYFGRENL